MAGEPVCPGDVIETATDGRIEIRFVDGTVFNLSHDAAVVLGDFARDTNGTLRSALFTVTRGAFAFAAGELAKAGSLTVDTPIGSIRSRSQASGFGLLSLATLIFSFATEAQAADPNVTFLDDDSVTYKDLHHGAFELVTKEAIPRHLVVEDPGETVVLSRTGSSVGVNTVANTPAQMQLLQIAQQDALANYAKGWGIGSGASPFPNPQDLLQPIKYVEPDPAPPQNQLPPLENAVLKLPDILPLTLNLGALPAENDTVVFDTFAATSGAFSAGNTNGFTPVFGISGGIAGNTVLGGVTYNESETGAFGTFYLNSASGAYTFVPNNDAINALKSNTVQTFVITLSAGSFSTEQAFNITIVGVNDASIISGATTGSVVAAVGVTSASPGLLIATGLLTDTDVDDPANTFTAVNSPIRSAGGYGTFTITTDGVWTYTLDDANSAVQALGVGGTLTDNFTVTTIGGTPQVVTITVHGPLIGVTGTGPALTLSEAHLTATALDDNIAGSAPDAVLTTISGDFSTAFASALSADGATIGYALTIVGGNGIASGLIDSHTGLADVLVLNGSTIEGRVGTTGGTLAFTITVDPATGLVTFTEYRAVTQPFGGNPDTGEGMSLTPGILDLVATVTEKDDAFQTANLDLGGRLTITDDGPSIGATGTAPSLTLSETHLTATALDDNTAGSAPNAALTTTSADFATAFTSVQGADGASIRYALAITGGDGTASGLIDSHTGLADVLVLNGNTIEGHVGTTGGTLAFTITVDPATGLVTFTEYRAVTQPFGTNPDSGEGVSLTPGIVDLVATITDRDGDVQTASLDLGQQLTITDDGPSIRTTGTGPSLTLSETHLTATALDDNIAGSAPNAALTTTSGDFSTAFISVQGADGATIRYALAITGGNGTASGLIDSHTGLADVLVLSGNTIEGHVGTTGGTLAFTITVDPATGLVTFTEYRAVTQPFGTSPDTGEGVSLTPGIVDLVATITDTDGDFQTASLDLGMQLTITDDGPTIGGFEQAFVAAQNNQVVNGTYNLNFGADGDAAMLVAVSDGAVGSTGYNLATSSLGGGITSVHVTGNGDDYTFYYSTHAVGGGVELDAYLTDVNGTLSNPYFTLLINPNGTYTFDVENVGLLKQVTVAGSDFGASGGGTPSLTAPDGNLVITGSDSGGNPLDVKASSNGIAVGDTGLQMDPNEDLHLAFAQQQSQVSFILTQWQGNGTADVIFRILDGSNDIHDFNINIPKPAGGSANIVVQQTSNAALVGTHTFDSATLTYTLYVGQTFNQIQVDYDQATTGNATFTVNNITYDEETTIPSTDLLFNVSAVDADGDSATTSLQVNLQGSTTGAPALASTSTSSSNVPIGGSGTGATTITSSATTGTATVIASATPSTSTGTNVDTAPDVLTAVSAPTKGGRGYRSVPTTATTASVPTTANHGAASALTGRDALTDVLGGLGAVLLTGANASHAFAKSSPAGSDLTWFVSGSDKIDLTAFGPFASALLALTPTSTSVPAHTIAWRYDSATNQAIVYVNPTDHTLSIGDSSLVAIHLPGVANVHLSDFVLATTTATHDDATIALVDASDATALTPASSDASSDAKAHHGFDATRDAIDDGKSASFTHGGTLASVDDAATSLPSGLSLELPHVAMMALTQASFVFDQVPMFDSANAMTIDHGAVPHGAAAESGNWLASSGNDWKDDSDTLSKNQDHGVSPANNAGATNAGNGNGNGNHSTASDTGEQAASTHGASAHDDGASPPGQAKSGDSVGTPWNAFHFKDNISGADGSDVNDAANDNPASKGHHDDAAVTQGSQATLVGGETSGTSGDSFTFKDWNSSPKGSAATDLAELNQTPAVSNGLKGTNVPPGSDGAQAVGLSSHELHPGDYFNGVPGQGENAHVIHALHDLIV
ncbi:DUF5801 repeats-in-toxin domain-containing protein [Bradyrhizobium sp. ISRA463]|nr:DUF5801 repeats-in-toxin domain-containing protein [Bradyrhizobium sp. ISRA463]WGS23081.1 DUF5801 domain-containing protein [Bradyrhizobium sp. ISRA463]